MIITGNYIQVKELKKDLVVDGLIQKYDDSSPYMFGKVLNANSKILDELSVISPNINNTVILFNRVNKIPYLNSYFVDRQNVIAIMDMEEYNNL